MTRLRFAFFAFLAMIGGLAATVTPASAAVDGSTFQGEDVPLDLRWQSCFEEFGPRFECATARVPLDYDKLDAGKIAIELVRLPATGEKKGSLFLNPGGPGGSGVDIVLGAGPVLYTPEVREAYDLVGFDPRGIIRSSPLLCFGTFNAAVRNLAPFAFPTNVEEQKVLRKANSFLQTQCENRGGIIQNKMSSANVARDMEVLRAAVGDEKLNFAGYSYGSVLGQVYAGLFPENVGHIIIDGVIDIRSWVGSTTGRGDTTLGQRLRSDLGAEDTFDEFIRLCEENGAACALAPQTEDRVNALLDNLRAAPLDIVDPATGEVVFVVTYSDTIGSILGSLYNSASWTGLADFLAAVEFFQLTSAPPTMELARLQQDLDETTGRVQSFRRQPPYPNFIEGFPGVTCVDTSNPSRFQAWADAAAAANVEAPNFGELWTWNESMCNRWPGKDNDRFVGPFSPVTANPVLVLSTEFDPATSYQQAQSAAAALPNSSLITVEGWGHTTLFTSSCADAVVAAYLLDDVVAPNGTVCPQDQAIPFTDGAGFQASARTAVLQHTRMPR